MADITELRIERVGAQGDGIARVDGHDIYVPFTLAGERVTATFEGDRARVDAIIEASPHRVDPVCHHFGVCGGCALQHMATDLYEGWKRDQIIIAFAARGISADVEALAMPEGGRRRAVFSAEKSGGDDVELGFHAGQSHVLIDIRECPVLDPMIVRALPALRALLAVVITKKSRARVTVTVTNGGLDVTIDDVRRPLGVNLRSEIARAAAAGRFARVSLGDDVVYEALAPEVALGGVDVIVPPGGFLQAMADAETTMTTLAVEAIAKTRTKSVVDLFSGAGAFTFALAKRWRVSAFDSDARSVAALAAAARKASGLKPIVVRARDLFREPLSALELNEHDAVVFDPPRAGADAQARMIAKSKVKCVVAISCNPATLARDARTLIDGGYGMSTVVPVDQFRYSPHIEAVAVFTRKS